MARSNIFIRRGQSTTVERYGKTFQSITEANFYGVLLNMKIPFQWQVVHILQDPVRKAKAKIPLFETSGVPQVKLTVDFEFDHNGIHYIVDTKGSKKYVLEASKTRYNLLKGRLFAEGRHDTKILMIDYKEVNTLSKLSMRPQLFWPRFNEIKPL